MPKIRFASLDPSLPWVVYLRHGKTEAAVAAFAHRAFAVGLRDGFNRDRRSNNGWRAVAKRRKT